MSATTAPAVETIMKNANVLTSNLETLYKDVHAHPELSMQAGTKENVISDEAVIKLNARAVGAAPASEDFGSFGTQWDVPSVFWFVGGPDPDVSAKAKAENRVNEIPTNHSPQFLPVLHPALEPVSRHWSWLPVAGWPRNGWRIRT